MMDLRKEGCWEDHYIEELKNFEENGDEGEVWFGEALTKRIVNRILQEFHQPSQFKPPDRINILDIGCGNSFLLCKLAEKLIEQSSPVLERVHLTGIDYAERSIKLSKKVVESRGLSKLIRLEQCDFIDVDEVRTATQEQKIDIIIDKGTFDAICLLSDDTASVRTKYMQSVYSIVKPGSIFILASCNHTEDELLTMFDGTSYHFKLLGRMETPKLKFGGVEGSQVCCLVIKFE